MYVSNSENEMTTDYHWFLPVRKRTVVGNQRGYYYYIVVLKYNNNNIRLRAQR